jgi:hypothetical protein
LRRVIGASTRGALDSVLGGQAPQDAGASGWGGGPSPWHFSPIGALGGGFSEGFAFGLSRQLQAELGPNGDGPLAQTLTRVVERASAAAVAGAAQQLAPMTAAECAGMDNKKCADMRVYELSRSAADGFVDGLGAAIHLPLMILAFAGGLLTALLGALVFVVSRRRIGGLPRGPSGTMPSTRM